MKARDKLDNDKDVRDADRFVNDFDYCSLKL